MIKPREVGSGIIHMGRDVSKLIPIYWREGESGARNSYAALETRRL